MDTCSTRTAQREVGTCPTRSGHLLNSARAQLAQLEMDTCSTRGGNSKWTLAQVGTWQLAQHLLKRIMKTCSLGHLLWTQLDTWTRRVALRHLRHWTLATTRPTTTTTTNAMTFDNDHLYLLLPSPILLPRLWTCHLHLLGPLRGRSKNRSTSKNMRLRKGDTKWRNTCGSVMRPTSYHQNSA